MRFFSFLLTFILFGFSNLNAQNDFTVSSDEEHYAFIIPGNVIDIKEYRGSVTKYIWKMHAKDRLKINNIQIGDSKKVDIIHVTTFRNKVHAMSFFNKTIDDYPDFMHMNMTKMIVVISKSNYEAIIRNQEIGNYQAFFDENYSERKS